MGCLNVRNHFTSSSELPLEGGFSDRALRRGHYNITREALNIIRDLCVMAECKGLVGTFSSNIGRSSLLLAILQIHPNPFFSYISLLLPPSLSASLPIFPSFLLSTFSDYLLTSHFSLTLQVGIWVDGRAEGGEGGEELSPCHLPWSHPGTQIFFGKKCVEDIWWWRWKGPEEMGEQSLKERKLEVRDWRGKWRWEACLLRAMLLSNDFWIGCKEEIKCSNSK